MSFIPHISPQDFHRTHSLLREFFLAKNFVEVHTQNRLSILAACEDPNTIASYTYAGQVWPLPQTGQMWLEHELLRNPELPGVFCLSTSYRHEKSPIKGRHNLIFPMFEFETRGTMDDMRQLEGELLEYLGFGARDSFPGGRWDDVAAHYQTDDIDSTIEGRIEKEYGSAFFLSHFPERTSPFWNMASENGIARKIDVLLFGCETIGSAERSCDVQEMRHLFYSISNGGYASILFDKFGKDRVEKELNEFLSYDFFPRFGGGIGMTRMIRALELLEGRNNLRKAS
ncbi:MAG: amino acid--tRNA ligase-related protein [Pseudomonadota bacterium]